MHLWQVTPTSYAREGVIGGGERIALYIDQSLRKAAVEAGIPLTTTLLSLDAAEPFGAGSDRYQGISGKAWDASSLRAEDLIERLRQADIVFVHQCLTPVGLFVAAHARLLGKPVYGSDAGAGESVLLAMNPDAALVYDAVHAISGFGETVFAGLPVPVHVVPGPVDTESYVPQSEAPIREQGTVLALGRVLPHKGYERTIRALPPGGRLDIVGQHYDRDYLAFLKSCAAGKDVHFHDDLDDAAVRRMFERAGVLVHSSTHVDYRGAFHDKPELLGLAPLEALSTGLPTFVSNAGSLPELGVLPGCRVFHSQEELAALLADVASGRIPPVD
ncbi:MAG: glycosyltransferase family 4 protein, partial [Hyphomicrobiaceae bacterium]|nr:glycosyltransferase family 4 protein [Hyphomicrobiaceae bacterium]